MPLNLESRSTVVSFAGVLGDDGSAKTEHLAPVWRPEFFLPTDQNMRVTGCVGYQNFNWPIDPTEVAIPLNATNTAASFFYWINFATPERAAESEAVAKGTSPYIGGDAGVGAGRYVCHPGVVFPVNAICKAGLVPMVAGVFNGSSTGRHYNVHVSLFIELI